MKSENKINGELVSRLRNLCDVLIRYTLMDFTVKAEISDYGDEVDAIAVGLNTMAEELQCARISEKKYINELMKANSQLKKSEKKITSINKQLEKRVEERTRELVESEKKIQERETRFRSSLDNMLEGIQIIDSEWKYLYVNSAVYAHGKYTKDDLVGSTMLQKYPGIEKTELFRVLTDCMKNRLTKNIENEFIYSDGSKGWFELSIQPVPEGLLILSIDITKRKKAEEELKKLNDDLEIKIEDRTLQLLSVNKELEAFTYSVSHDLRAPLRAISGYSNMLKEEYSGVLNDEGKRLLSVVQQNAKKMGTLIDDLLAFSRLGRKELSKTNLDMKELAEGALIEINKSWPHRARVVIDNLPPARGDYGLINQVFVNLISNGIKYSSKKTDPCIEIGSENKNNETIYFIKDNGVGFDMRYVHKLFEVFHRLHNAEDFDGTGVGLAIVHRIIAKHGGRIWADAKLNEGAVFSFSLPEI